MCRYIDPMQDLFDMIDYRQNDLHPHLSLPAGPSSREPEVFESRVGRYAAFFQDGRQ